jgi:hypothetical protein
MEIPKKFKMELVYDPAFLLQVGNEIDILQRHLHSHVHCSTIHNSQGRESI